MFRTELTKGSDTSFEIVSCIFSLISLSECLDLRDPCEEKECHFGAECQPSLDGRSAECLCPAQCATYGESSRSRPVCGTDGKDYPNVCEMRRTSCLEMRPINVRYKGNCGKNFGNLRNYCLSLRVCMLFKPP